VEWELVYKKIYQLFCVNSDILSGWEASLVEGERLYEVYGYSRIDCNQSGTKNSFRMVRRRFVNGVKDIALIFRSDVVERKMELND
jgi:hypothetical protein